MSTQTVLSLETPPTNHPLLASCVQPTAMNVCGLLWNVPLSFFSCGQFLQRRLRREGVNSNQIPNPFGCSKSTVDCQHSRLTIESLRELKRRTFKDYYVCHVLKALTAPRNTIYWLTLTKDIPFQKRCHFFTFHYLLSDWNCLKQSNQMQLLNPMMDWNCQRNLKTTLNAASFKQCVQEL